MGPKSVIHATCPPASLSPPMKVGKDPATPKSTHDYLPLCPHCSKPAYDNTSTECANCGQQYHFQCECLTKNDINNIEEIPSYQYICGPCKLLEDSQPQEIADGMDPSTPDILSTGIQENNIIPPGTNFAEDLNDDQETYFKMAETPRPGRPSYVDSPSMHCLVISPTTSCTTRYDLLAAELDTERQTKPRQRKTKPKGQTVDCHVEPPQIKNSTNGTNQYRL